jgi:hypothetical protein
MVLVSSSDISITGKYYIVLLLFPEFSHFDFYFLCVKSPYSNHYLTAPVIHMIQETSEVKNSKTRSKLKYNLLHWYI